MKLGKNNITFFKLALILSVLLLFGCRSTRYVPDDRYLLSDIDIKIDNKQVDKNEVANYLKQKENLKILGFIKFHLWLYNISDKNKEKSLLREIGEPPVIYDKGLHEKSKEQIIQYLYNKGYYQAKVSDEIELKNKRAFLTYRIQTGEPYMIRNVKYEVKDTAIAKYIDQTNNETLIKSGDIFDVDVLDKERTRIRRILNDEGYYKFVEDYIHFRIDSSLNSKIADVNIIIENPGLSTEGNEYSHKKYKIKDYEISIYNPDKNGTSGLIREYTDTTKLCNYTFYHNGKLPLNKNVIIKTIENYPNELYNKTEEERLYNNLFSLRQFKYVNIQFNENTGYKDSLNGYLTGKIYLPMQVKQNYSIDIEGTNTSGNLGIAGNLNYQHRNLFGGAQIFDFKLRGATERQVSISGGNTSIYNMNEIGGEAKLSFPGFIFPVDEHMLKLYSMPFTYFSMAYNFQDRQNYTRTLVNATFGYQWKSTSDINHYFNLLDLNAVRIFRFDSTFFNSIQDLYIKYSYTNHIVSATNYSFIYNDQDLKKKPGYNYVRINLEAAGNTLWLYNRITGQKSYNLDGSEAPVNSPGYYKIFDTRFAQYLKGDIEYRYGYRFDKYNSFASRAFLGVALPYGNFDVIPFEKMYFTGGANGIRAWQVRSLGPGSYVPGENEYPNQSSDIKIEANIEYRFNIIWNLEGALFVDAGNIWAINNSDNREGAVFSFNRFYKEFAIGTGVGLRLVTNYFIIRADIGMKLRDPSRPDGSRWIPGGRSYQGSDFNLNIGIGYPF